MNEQRDEPDKRPRLNLTTSQVAASALAACCASIVASYLGVAGTVIGAAVGSVVATIGAAVYSHLFRRGSARIRRTLLVNGRIQQDVDVPESARPEDVRAGRFYGARDADAAEAEAETRPAGGDGRTTGTLWLPASSAVEKTRAAIGEPTVIAGTTRGDEPTRLATAADFGRGDEPTRLATAADFGRGDEPTRLAARAAFPGGDIDGGDGRSRPVRRDVTGIRRYRKSIGVVAAIVAVFCVSITVGFLLGGPVRSVGSDSAPPATTATTATTQDQQGSGGGQTSGTTPSSSASTTPSDTTSATPTPSAGGTSTGTPGASQSPSTTASPTGTGAGTGTATPGTPTQQPLGAAGNTAPIAP